jgi:hypothetical protein
MGRFVGESLVEAGLSVFNRFDLVCEFRPKCRSPAGVYLRKIEEHRRWPGHRHGNYASLIQENCVDDDHLASGRMGWLALRASGMFVSGEFRL